MQRNCAMRRVYSSKWYVQVLRGDFDAHSCVVQDVVLVDARAVMLYNARVRGCHARRLINKQSCQACLGTPLS